MSVRRVGTAAIVASAALLSFVLAAPADAYIYWANTNGGADGQGTIGRANNDGTSVNHKLIRGLSRPCGLAVNSRHIYWANAATNTIGRANLDGTGRDVNFITGASDPCGPSLTPTHVYWANRGGTSSTTIGRATLGGIPESSGINFGDPDQTAVNSNYLLWTDFPDSGTASVWRFQLGLGPPELIAQGPADAGNTARWPAATGTHVYWAKFLFAGFSSTVVRREIEDSPENETQPIITGSDARGGVAIHAGKLYWSHLDDGTISRANLNGTAQEPPLVTGTPNSAGIAVNSGRTPSPPTPQPTDCTGFEIGKADRNKKKGKATLPVEVPCAGSVELSGKGVKAASAQLEGRGEADLAVKAKGKAKKALRKEGRKKVKPEVTYTPEGGEAQTETTKVKLVKK